MPRGRRCLWEHQRPVIGQQRFHPQPLALLLLHLQIQGRDVLLHLTAELVQLRPAIAQTLHTEIAVVGKAVEAVFTGQLVPGMDQLPQELFHYGAVFHGGLLLGVIGALRRSRSVLVSAKRSWPPLRVSPCT